MTGSITSKTKYYAFCSSITCSKYKAEGKLKPNVIGTPIECPDCGSALFWSKHPKIRQRSPANRTMVSSGKFMHKEQGKYF